MLCYLTDWYILFDSYAILAQSEVNAAVAAVAAAALLLCCFAVLQFGSRRRSRWQLVASVGGAFLSFTCGTCGKHCPTMDMRMQMLLLLLQLGLVWCGLGRGGRVGYTRAASVRLEAAWPRRVWVTACIVNAPPMLSESVSGAACAAGTAAAVGSPLFGMPTRSKLAAV